LRATALLQELLEATDERQGAPPQRVVGVEYLCAIVDNTCVVPPALPSDGASRKCGFLLQHTGRPLGGGLLAVLTPRPRYSTSQLGVVRLASARLTGGTRWG
jgi:hypothetical protein